MEIASHSQVTLQELNIVLGTVSDAYAVLSQKYYLPDLSSKAITKEYLKKIFFSNVKILRVPRTITSNYVDYKGTTVPEMLEKLEDFLKKNDYPSTGLDGNHHPDYQWIYDVCVWIDPTNKMGIVRSHVPSNDNLTRTIDQE